MAGLHRSVHVESRPLVHIADVRCDGDPIPMTSLQREAAGRIRIQGVRQRLVELVAARFGFDRVSVFHAHPAALPQANRHAAAQRT